MSTNNQMDDSMMMSRGGFLAVRKAPMADQLITEAAYNAVQAERDALQAENTRLNVWSAMLETKRDELQESVTCLEANCKTFQGAAANWEQWCRESRTEVDRLSSQVTDATALLHQWIADYDNEAWPYPAKATREFLGMLPNKTDYGMGLWDRGVPIVDPT